MNRIQLFLFVLFIVLMAGCSRRKPDEKGFPVSHTTDGGELRSDGDATGDSLLFETRPSNVLLTGVQQVRLTTIYKVNWDKEERARYIGTNAFHRTFNDDEPGRNNWHGHLMPGLEAVYGYNLVNIGHYSIDENKQKNFFDRPVLIRTLYYPSAEQDTLNGQPVHREYFIVTVYTDDTNKDGLLNVLDLRRMFLFNIRGEKEMALVPEDYSVFKSEYDPLNDFMYVFAQWDENRNGKRDESEPTHIFWIDLKDPHKTGKMF